VLTVRVDEGVGIRSEDYAISVAFFKSKLLKGYDGLSLSGEWIALLALPNTCRVLLLIKPGNQMLNVPVFCSRSLCFKRSVFLIRFLSSSFSSSQEYSFGWQIPGWIVPRALTFLMCQPH
jgi:hypothetical protein